MRIINVVLGDATGGRWQVARHYAGVLSACGHQVILLCNKRHPPVMDEPAGTGYEIRMIRSSGHYDPVSSFTAWRMLQAFRPDLVIAHCSRSIALFSRISRSAFPVVAVTHSNKVKRSLPADAFINISRHIEKMICQQGGAKKPHYYIPNSIDTGSCTPRQQHSLRTPLRIGAIGRFDPVKGLDLYLHALAQLKQGGLAFTALLGGDGNQKQALKQLVDKLGLQKEISMTGWIEDKQGFFTDIDVLCIPARSDAFGLTPLEAAIAGVPLIVSDAHGHREMFTDGVHALFFRRDDTASLVTAFETLIRHPDAAVERSRQAYTRVCSEFSEEQFARRLCTAVKEIAAL